MRWGKVRGKAVVSYQFCTNISGADTDYFFLTLAASPKNNYAKDLLEGIIDSTILLLLAAASGSNRRDLGLFR